MNPPLLDRISHDCAKRVSGSLLRTLPIYNPDTATDLSTNSYLALQKFESISREAAQLTNNQVSGNLASRLIAQTSPLYAELERELADWKKTESSLIFNSGYTANVGIIQALCTRHTDIFCDKLNHASIIDGILLSGGRLLRYRHKDMKDLERQLSLSTTPHKLIVTDTIFSMDGDRAPLEEICELGRRFGCVVMVDEAHATGIFGLHASGIVERTGTAQGVHVRIGTLSKAIAGLGGFFAGNREIRDFLVNNARSFVYSTGLPHSVLAYNLAAVRFIRRNPHLGKELLDLATDFRNDLTDAGFDCMGSTTQIVPVRMNSSREALCLSAFLKENGISAPAIRPPTVPKGSERIRFSVHLGLGASDLDRIVKLMVGWRSKKNG